MIVLRGCLAILIVTLKACSAQGTLIYIFNSYLYLQQYIMTTFTENGTEGGSLEELTTTENYKSATEVPLQNNESSSVESEDEEVGGTTILYSGFFSPGQLEDPCSRECLPGAPPKHCRYCCKEK